MSKRIQYIDLARGFCITLVVLFHIFQSIHFHYGLVYWKTLPVFLLPLFFFLSGLFFKEYEGFLGFFLRKVNKLLIPFFFFYIVTSFALPNILNLLGYTVSDLQMLGISGLWAFLNEDFPNGPLWFLLVLFLINIYFYVILVSVKHMTSNKNVEAAIVTIVCFAIGSLGITYISRNFNLFT